MGGTPREAPPPRRSRRLVGGLWGQGPVMCFLNFSVTGPREPSKAVPMEGLGPHRGRQCGVCDPCVRRGHVCAGECVCRPLTLTQRVSWAQGLGGHAAVHGQIERLLHFGPDDSVRKRRNAHREKRRKQDQWLPQIQLPFKILLGCLKRISHSTCLPQTHDLTPHTWSFRGSHVRGGIVSH